MERPTFPQKPEFRTAGAELRLIPVVLTTPGLVDAVRAHVVDRQVTSLQHGNRNLISGPNFFCADELLGGQVSLSKDLEGVASILLRWQCSNAGFKVSEAFESVKRRIKYFFIRKAGSDRGLELINQDSWWWLKWNSSRGIPL